MALKVEVKVEGMKELEQALLQLKASTARNVMRRALIDAAKPIAEEAKRLVPVDKGHLRDSIKIWTKSTNRVGTAEYAGVKRAGGSDEEAVAALRSARREAKRFGPSAPQMQVTVAPSNRPNAHLVEFGSVHNIAQPYMRPAWERNKDRALESIKINLTNEIAKATARADRKAKRDAARLASGK